MLFNMAVSLYTSRVILNALGAEDYGIYNVVGGVVAMFSFLNSAMTASTQRYITFELGKDNIKRLKEVFSTSINIHVFISFIVVVLGETIGLWFLHEKIVIPEDRIIAATVVYQLSILTTIVAIMSYPFNADIVAHEKMTAFAYISIIETTLKLGIAFLIGWGNSDKLILYAILIAIVQVVVCLSYVFYCRKNFIESNYKFHFDKKLFKEMLGFAGWNLWGNLAAILMTQGVNILLNIFFGPIVNAARAITIQVQNAIHQFAMNFQMALNPQITKTYAMGKFEELNKLIFRSSKFTFLLLFIICFPVFLETPFILQLWLKTVPEHTITFLRIIILILLIDSSANPLMVAAAATGRIKLYQTIIGGTLLLILPISYYILKQGGEAWSVFLVHLSICICAYIIRLIIIKSLIDFELKEFIKQVILRCLIVVLLSIIIPITLRLYISEGVGNSFIIITTCVVCSSIVVLFIGLDNHERTTVLNKSVALISRFKKNDRDKR